MGCIKRSMDRSDGCSEAKSTLSAYFADVACVKILGDDEQAKLWADGSEEARKRIMVSYLPYVVSMAKKFFGFACRSDDEMLELISAGNEGLAIAAGRFDHTPGNKFITYATYWIKERMDEQRARQLGFGIKVGRCAKDLALVSKVEREVADGSGLNTTSDSLVQADSVMEALRGIMGDEKAEKMMGLRSLGPSVPTSLTSEDGDDIDVEDQSAQKPSEIIERAQMENAVEEALSNRLSEKERFVIEAYYGLGKFRGRGSMTCSNIAKALASCGLYSKEVSRQSVDNIKNAALGKLRKDDSLAQCFGIAPTVTRG